MEIKTASITVDWKVDNLGELFNPNKTEFRDRWSPAFDNGRWCIKIEVNNERTKDGDNFGLFLCGQQLETETTNGVWSRKEDVRWQFEVLRLDGSRLYSSAACKKGPDEWTGDNFGWGRSEYSGKALYADDEAVKADDAFIIRCTLSQQVDGLGALAESLPSFRKTSRALFEDPATSDVLFRVLGAPYFDQQPQLLKASKTILSSTSEYFSTMFKSSFKEGEAIKSTPKALIEVDFKSRSSWDNDDDSLEWLPDDWLKNHGPPEDGTMHGSDDEDVTNTKGWQVVKVTDAGFTTYRAMLFYLYTGEITFTPLASSLTVAVLEGKADDETSRRDYLLQKTPRSSDEVVKPASPHAVYKLADKLDLEDLKDRAKRRIIGGFKVENILYELVSTFSYQHEEIQDAARSFALKNWDAIKKTTAFTRVLDESMLSKIEGAGEIWRKLLEALPVTA